MVQELKVDNSPKLSNQTRDQAVGFLSRKPEPVAGAVIPRYYWPAEVRREYEAQLRDKQELAKQVYKPHRDLDRSIQIYRDRLDDQQRVIEKYEEYEKLYQQGLLTETGIKEMETWRGAILGKMGTGRSHDPLVERYRAEAAEAYEKGTAKGDFSEFFEVVERYRKHLEVYVEYYKSLQQPPTPPDFQITTPEQRYFVEAHRAGYRPLDLGYLPGIARAYLHQSLKDITSLDGLKNSEAVTSFLGFSEKGPDNNQTRVLNLDAQISERIRQGQDHRVKALNPVVAKAWAGLVRHGLYDSDGKKYDDATLMKLWGLNTMEELAFAKRHLFGAIIEDVYIRGRFSGISGERFQKLSKEQQQVWVSQLERDFLRLWRDTRRMF